MKLLLPFFAATALVGAEPVFEVTPPENLAFNYPDPPREGRADFFPIAAGGQARCVLVQPADASPSAQAAVRALQTYLALATGARFTLLSDDKPAPAGLAAIHIGDTVVGRKTDLALPELRYGDDRFPNLSGYLIKTLDPQTLVIRGASETATNHAIVGFLKRYLGIRQYWPGRPGGLGDVIPSHSTLSLPDLEWRDWPYFFSRTMTHRPFDRTRPALDFYRLNQTLRCTENYNQWLSPAKYGETHPEYFPLINGARHVPKESDGAKGWQPCLSNPDVPRTMGEAVVDYFRHNPQAAGVNFAINDGGGDCMCEHCRALDAPGTDYSSRRGMSDRYMKLTNEVCEIVAREFPSKWIVYLAYAAAQHSSTVKPHPMALPVLTGENAFVQWDEWMQTGARQLGLYEHHNDTFYLLPKLDVHQNARRLQYVVGSGRARVFYMESHTQWPFADAVPYTTGELTWDPRLDADRLLDEYFTSFYGPAAEPMRAYYHAVEAGYQRWLAEESTPHWFGKDMTSNRYPRVIEQFRVLNPEEAAHASTFLVQARERAASDEKTSQRIQVVQGMFGLQELAVRWAWAAFRLRDAAPKSEAEAKGLVADARLVFDLNRQMRRYIEDVLEKPPLASWTLFQNSTRPLAMYAELKTGEPGPEMLTAISTGLNASGEFLRTSLGGEKAGAWWRTLRELETEPALVAAFQAAENRALGKEPKNLLGDPGFEKIGAQLAPDAVTLERDVALDEKQLDRIGVKLWFPERSPWRCTITEGAAHSGRHAVTIAQCFRARFSQTAPAEPGARYRVGLWFKQNEGDAKYRFAVDARLKDGTYPQLATVPITGKPAEWRELVTEIVAPAGATSIILRLYIDKQTSGAQCWIDDAFIGR